jgi:hypothetical protein
MEPIELLSCVCCGRIVDQWTMIPECKRCKTNRFRAIQPTRFAIFRWFLNEPRHVFKLLWQDLKEKLHEARG